MKKMMLMVMCLCAVAFAQAAFLSADSVTATSYYDNGAGFSVPPEALINGEGLDVVSAAGLHWADSSAAGMTHAGVGEGVVALNWTFHFDSPVNLTDIYIWQFNQYINATTLARQVETFNLYVSTDNGATFTLANASPLTLGPVPGTGTIGAQTFALSASGVTDVRLDPLTARNGGDAYVGLSEVHFEGLGGALAWNPSPADETPDIPADVDLTLSWNTGGEFGVDPNITGHFVYFGDEPNSLLLELQNPTPLPLGTTTYTIDSTLLDKDKTYYWRIDEELNNGGTGNVHTGFRWSFDTELSVPQVDIATPTDQFVKGGEDAVFVVDATDPLGGVLSYAWYYDPNLAASGDEVLLSDGADYGIDGNSLTVYSVAVADEGHYYSEVSNLSEIPIKSNVASLTVKSLVGHWPFADDGTPAIAEDISGFGNDGAITGAVYVDDPDDPGNKVLSFDPNLVHPDYVDIPAAAFSRLTTEFSIAVWLYGGETQPQLGFVFMGNDSEGGRNISASVAWVNAFLYFDVADGTSLRVLKAMSEEEYKGQWNHWVFTRNVDTGGIAAYHNGALWVSGSGSNPLPEIASFLIGAYSTTEYVYDGMMKDFRLYDYELDANGVADLYYEISGNGTCLNSPQYDLNGDCLVNLSDFSILAAHWLTCNLVPDTGCP